MKKMMFSVVVLAIAASLIQSDKVAAGRTGRYDSDAQNKLAREISDARIKTCIENALDAMCDIIGFDTEVSDGQAAVDVQGSSVDESIWNQVTAAICNCGATRYQTTAFSVPGKGEKKKQSLMNQQCPKIPKPPQPTQITDNKTIQRIKTDSEIHTEISKLLCGKPCCDAPGILVKVFDGRVRLRGEVADPKLRAKAEQIAIKHGAKAVENNLKVSSPAPKK